MGCNPAGIDDMGGKAFIGLIICPDILQGAIKLKSQSFESKLAIELIRLDKL
jgi:hypothetical protein